MPQISIPYAIGRISVLRRQVMNMQQLERLLSTPTLEEAQRTLSDFGWALEDGDWETVADQKVRAAVALLKSLTTEAEATDSFFLRYDVANLKMLLKARFLGVQPEGLSHIGTIPLDNLRQMVTNHRYSELPLPLRKAMESLEKAMLVKVDPLQIDMVLDKAMYQLIQERLTHVKAGDLKTYFRAQSDLINANTLLRIRQMGGEVEQFLQALLPGGTIENKAWATAFAAPERLPSLLKPYGQKVVQAAEQAVVSFSHLPGLEKAGDDYLLSLFTAHKHSMEGVGPLIGYLLSVEREAAAVRLIMAAKLNGFEGDALRERLRVLYDQ